MVGRTDIEDALKKLDTLTNEESRMATAQVLKVTHTVDDRVRAVDDKVINVGDRLAGVDDRVVAVDDRVAGVNDKVASVDHRMEEVEVRVASVDFKVDAVDDKVALVIDGAQPSLITRITYLTPMSLEGKEARLVMDQVKRSSFPISIDSDFDCTGPINFTGNQSRQDLLKWLSPPDPSINHNIACGAHQKRTAEWFFQGGIFTEWKSSGSLLWLYGKRTLSLTFPV